MSGSRTSPRLVALGLGAMVAGSALAGATPVAAATDCTYTFPDIGGTYDKVVKAGQTICGGPGDDTVTRLNGGSFLGYGGNDHVETLRNGLFDGGKGDDTVGRQLSGYFLGHDGQDSLAILINGTFSGGQDDDSITEEHRKGVFAAGPGNDFSARQSGGTTRGGSGIDRVETLTGNAVFNGGPNRDAVGDLLGSARFAGNKGPDRVEDQLGDEAEFFGGPGDDRVLRMTGSARFSGGEDRDTVEWLHDFAVFNGGPKADTVARQLGGIFAGNKGPDNVGSAEGFYGLAAGLANGGPGKDSINICAGGTGTETRFEVTTTTTCP